MRNNVCVCVCTVYEYGVDTRNGTSDAVNTVVNVQDLPRLL